MKLQTHSTQTTGYQIRQESYQGRNYIVVPVVMMVEGVHNGSQGPLLHEAETLAQSVNMWNGMPVTIDHPQRDGQYISAREPDVHSVGTIFNTHMDGRKLKAEAWLDAGRLQAASALAYAHIMENKPLDVSIGVFTTDEVMEGEWNGEQYSAIARNHNPDHLALLPGEQGACSWADGCGIRLNKQMNSNQEKQFKKEDGMTEEQIKVMKELSGINLLTNDQGYRELLQSLQTKLDGMDSDMRVYFLQEVYDDHLIYEVRKRDTGEANLYKQSYTIQDNQVVEFVEDPVPVRRQVEYVQTNKRQRLKNVTNNEENKIINNEKKEGTKMSEKKEPCTNKIATVEALISCNRTRFVEKDREWLMKQEDGTLETLKAVELPEPKPQVNTKEEAMQVLRETIKKPEEFLTLLPDEMRDSMESGLRLHQEHRTGLIKSILNNAEGVWTEDELKIESTEKLEKIAKGVNANKEVDYSVNGEYSNPVATYEEKLLPPGVEEESK